MTRKSKRELTHTIDELEPNSVDEWVSALLQDSAEQISTGDELADDAVLVVAGTDYEFYVDAVDVPAWIDVDADLPVGADRHRK